MPRDTVLKQGNTPIPFIGREGLSDFDRKWVDIAVAGGLSPDYLFYVDKVKDREFTVWAVIRIPQSGKLEDAHVLSYSIEHYRGQKAGEGEYYRVRQNPVGRWETIVMNPRTQRFELYSRKGGR